MDKITHTPQVNNYPLKEVLHFRELYETKEFNDDFRTKVESAHKRKKEYEEKNKTSFGGIDKCHMKYIEDTKLIQRRILQERLIEEKITSRKS